MTGQGASSYAYRAEHKDAILIEALDMITLVYQRRSGITHLIAEPMPQILAALGDRAMTVAELSAQLAQEFDLADTPEDTETLIMARLAELQSLGLVSIESRDHA
jgi:PqqD family protein of HPr-rel-A system